jgi:hypothetical protein
MDEVLASYHRQQAFTDIHSPLLCPDVCDLEQVSNKLAKPPICARKLASRHT